MAGGAPVTPGPGGRPVGVPTRGTTAANRLRRVDRWLTHAPRVRAALQSEPEPVVVDLGYGRIPVTTLELAERVRAVAPGARVVGLEIDPERVAAARDAGPGVEFALGGFELAGLRPLVVRAFNVLRQYPEDAVTGAWRTMRAAIHPAGVILDGTCDESGRLAGWILLDAGGPVSLTLACNPRFLERPSQLAERLPKALIHQNVPGQPIHTLLAGADRAWATASGQSVFGPWARWQGMLTALRAAGVPVQTPRRPGRDAVLTVAWDVVAPRRVERHADCAGADPVDRRPG